MTLPDDPTTTNLHNTVAKRSIANAQMVSLLQLIASACNHTGCTAHAGVARLGACVC
jgi:hypothetical protein